MLQSFNPLQTVAHHAIFAAAASKKAPPKIDKDGIPDLSDPSVEEEVAEKYADFQDPTPLYRNMHSAVGILGQIFSAKEFNQTGRQFGVTNQATYPDVVQESANNTATITDDFFRMDRKTVDIGMTLKSLTFTLYPPKGPADSNFDTCVNIIKAYFPKFTYPKQWVLSKENPDKIIKRAPVMDMTGLTQEYPLETITQIKPRYSPNPTGQRGPSLYPELSRDYEPFNGAGFMQLSLVPVSARSDGYDTPDLNVKGGDIAGSDFGILFRIDVRGIIKFPMVYALYATTHEKIDQFSPLPFWNLIQQRHAYFNTAKKGKRSRVPEPSDRVGDISATYRSYQAIVADGRKPVKKANEDDFVITTDGEVLWIPTIDNIVGYQALQKKAYDTQKNKIMPSANIEGFKNQPIFSDWVTDKFVYTDNAGHIDVIDLMGSRPLDKITTLNYMNQRIDADCAIRLARICDDACVKFKVYPAGDALNLNNDANKLMNLLLNSDHPMTWADIGTQKFGSDDEYPKEKAAAKRFTQLITDTIKYFDKFDLDYTDRIGFVRLYYVILSKYSTPAEYTELREHRTQAVERNSAPITEQWDPRKPLKIYNLPGLTGMMPHQVETEQMLRMDPDGAIVDIEPGGGKTLLAIIDAARALGTGATGRPLICVPGNMLVRDFVNEINFWSQGKLNAFPITRAVWNRWINDIGLTEQQVEKIIRSQPKNTIFITDYNFLSFGKSGYRYGDYYFEYMPTALFMSNLGFDYIWCDESHMTRNKDSGRSKATSIVAARTSKQRLASGTIIYNVASDMVGQTGIINPAIFTSKDAFNNAFADKDSKGTVITDEGRAEIFRQLAPYARKITMKRKKWAYLLPPMEENFHTVDLTPNQQEFYNARQQEIMDDIMQDEKLMKLIKSGDPSVEGAIEEAMKRYFAKLEIFVNAPDSLFNDKQYGAVFRNLSTTKANDLISAKIKAIDKICAAHIASGNPNKILIFGYNKAVSVHIFEKMAHRGIAVRYEAGDMETFDKARLDPKVRILVADENSINTGQNLQMFSRLIRLQTLWTPGQSDQAIARIFRPDVPDAAGKTKYDHDRLYFDWIITDNTLEIAKTARLISKMIQKARVDNGDDPSFIKLADVHAKELDAVVSLSMNLDALIAYSSVDSLQDSFTGYAIYKKWEDEEFRVSKAQLKVRLEKIYGRPIRDAEVASLAMQKVDGTLIIPGTQDEPSYVPWVEGALPPDPGGLNMIPIATRDDITDDDGDEDTTTPADDSVYEGMLVMTEFGPGVVAKMRKNSSSIYVHVPGFSKGAIKLPRTVVFKITNASKAAALQKKLNMSKGGLPKLRLSSGPLDTPNQIPVDQKAIIKDVKIDAEVEKKTPVVGKPWSVSIEAYMLNLQPALSTSAGDHKFASRLINRGWKPVGHTIGLEIKTFQAMIRLLDYMRSNFTVPSINQAEMVKFADLMKKNKSNLEKIRTKDIVFMRNYFLEAKRKPKDKTELHPHVMVVNGAVFVVFNLTANPSARRMMSMRTKLQGVSKAQDLGNLLVKFVLNKSNMLKEIEAIKETGVVIDNADDLAGMVKAIK